MIITRTPFRVSFAGGGSDLPAFYERQRGAVLTTSINKYLYTTVHPYFEPGEILVKYSRTETCNTVGEVEHPLVRESMRMTGVDCGVELTFTDGALHKVVELTVSKGTGARGLRSVLEQSLMDSMYDIPSQEGTRELVVTDAMIKTGADDDSDSEDELLWKRA